MPKAFVKARFIRIILGGQLKNWLKKTAYRSMLFLDEGATYYLPVAPLVLSFIIYNITPRTYFDANFLLWLLAPK